MPNVRWRPAAVADVPECLLVQRDHMGDALVGEAVALAVWRELMVHPATLTAVFETDRPNGDSRMIGFGATVFVQRAFANAELFSPSPGLNARIIASLHHGPSVILDRDAIARANAGDGVDVAMLYGCWLSHSLSGHELQQVQAQLAMSLAQLLAGYKARTLFGEAHGAQVPYMRQSGTVREIATYPERDSVLNLMMASDAFARPTSVGGAMFIFDAPVLHLTTSEQALLNAALTGATDADLATSLGVSLSAIKARWRSIFARFAELAPDYESAERDGRGPQKRHHVLRYLRDHPEELRPFRRG
jgi:hypothetical protein